MSTTLHKEYSYLYHSNDIFVRSFNPVTRNSNISEEELISLLNQQPVLGMAMLYDQYACALYGVIFRIVKEDALAELILKETFLKIRKNFSQFNPEQSRVFTWMMNIARTISFEKTKSNAFKGAKHSSVLENRDGNSSKINKVVPAQTKTIDLILFDGRSPDEASTYLNIPTASIRSKVRAEIIQLKQQQLSLKEN